MQHEITISKDYPIIAGMVQVPPNLEYSRNTMPVERALSLIPGSQVVQLSLGSGRIDGHSGAQQFLRIPGQPLDCCGMWLPDPQQQLATTRPSPPVFSLS